MRVSIRTTYGELTVRSHVILANDVGGSIENLSLKERDREDSSQGTMVKLMSQYQRNQVVSTKKRSRGLDRSLSIISNSQILVH